MGGQRLLSLRDDTLKERHCYDGRGWLKAVVNATSDVACNSLDSATGLQSRFVYGYDGRGNRLSQEYLDGSLSAVEQTRYGYDGADWLTGVKYPDGHAALYQLAGDGTRTGEREVSGYAGGLGPDGYAAVTNPTKDWTYGFDSQGGLRTATQPEVQPGGGVTQVEVASWTTDGAGRVTRSVTPEGTRTFAWSARDTLGQATFTPAIAGGDGTPVTVSYGYDGDGLRRSRAVNGSPTGYLWAAGQFLEERLPGNAILYAHAAGTAISAGADRLAHDGLGSVVGFVGATATTRKYDAWGAFVGGTALTSVQPSVAYAGQAFDADLGLSYAQQRWYDSATGRFLSEDSARISNESFVRPARLGSWLYANCSPTSYVDPMGRAGVETELLRYGERSADADDVVGEVLASTGLALWGVVDGASLGTVANIDKISDRDTSGYSRYGGEDGTLNYLADVSGAIGAGAAKLATLGASTAAVAGVTAAPTIIGRIGQAALSGGLILGTTDVVGQVAEVAANQKPGIDAKEGMVAIGSGLLGGGALGVGGEVIGAISGTPASVASAGLVGAGIRTGPVVKLAPEISSEATSLAGDIPAGVGGLPEAVLPNGVRIAPTSYLGGFHGTGEIPPEVALKGGGGGIACARSELEPSRPRP